MFTSSKKKKLQITNHNFPDALTVTNLLHSVQMKHVRAAYEMCHPLLDL